MNHPKKQFKGVWIPASIWNDEDLEWREKCILAEISALSSESQPCYASDAHLAQMFFVSTKTMSNIISSLRRRGYIVGKFDGSKRLLRVKWEASNRDYSLPGNKEVPIPENREVSLPENREVPLYSIEIPEKDTIGSCNNDAFFDDLFFLETAPKEVCDRIAKEALAHGLEEDALGQFAEYINGMHFKIRGRARIRGLKDVVKNFKRA